MAITPREVEAVGQVSDNTSGSLIHVARWLDQTYEGRQLAPGRWFHLTADNASLGMIDMAQGQCFAYRTYEVGQALGRTFTDALRYLGSSS